MDLGVLGLGGLLHSKSDLTSPLASEPESKLKWGGSGGFTNQERSRICEDEPRDFKVAKTTAEGCLSASKAMLLHHRSPLLRSNNNLFSDAQQMLSFSSPASQTEASAFYSQTPADYPRNTGYGTGGLSTVAMNGILTAARGPFTPSQWMELEHQALIYKYIIANVPIPSHLLVPIRKALESAKFSSFSGLRPNTLAWGPFHLGFTNNSDPEPGRCRRTDGKKWRCSRDAVADQKYCERHMNRGRHRSRKHVEGQTGHSASGDATNAVKVMPVSSSISASVVAGGGTSNNLSFSGHHQLINLQPHESNSSQVPNLSRNVLNKNNQDTTGLSMLLPSLAQKENQFSILKEQNPYEEPVRTEFGLVCSDSLLNPLDKNTSLINFTNYGSSEALTDQENKTQYLLCQFMDKWPKNQSECSSISWPNIDSNPDNTLPQLSISIPMSSSDFMSSTSSPTNQKLAPSSPLLTSEYAQTHMGLGVGVASNEANQVRANWMPISIGGPLGEVLQSTNNSSGDRKSISTLNLMTDGQDSSTPLTLSPNEVLHKASYGSISNSSLVNSPITENSNALGGSNHFNAGLGSTFINSSLRVL